MRILYFSCHEILHFDECNLLTELGHEVFCPGAWVQDEHGPNGDLRPGIKKCANYEELFHAWDKLGKPGIDNRELVTKDFVDRFDLVIVMHIPRWISINWDAMKDKPVIWRTIGQSVDRTEHSLKTYREQGLKIARYSPAEASTPHYLGSDGLIRFYKDDTEFNNWNGQEEAVITFAQSMKKRGPACQFDVFDRVTESFPRKLFGPNNEDAGIIAQGKVSYEELKAAMRDHRAYFYTGTHPASYTLNFMEAIVTGMPIVAIGTRLGNAPWAPNHKLYEVDSIIEHGVNGFCSDKENELIDCCRQLLGDKDLADKISAEARKTGVKLFGKTAVKKQWEDFLGAL